MEKDGFIEVLKCFEKNDKKGALGRKKLISKHRVRKNPSKPIGKKQYGNQKLISL